MRKRVAVLGASGLVGQRLQQRLSAHPDFELVAVVGSARTAGLPYGMLPWGLEGERPELDLPPVFDASTPTLMSQLVDHGVEWAFSAMPSTVAAGLETAIVEAGVHVCSNASAHRRRQGIPLVVADVNPEHLNTSRGGALHACATNCTLLPLLMPYLALHRRFGVRSVRARSEQARSGAGYALLRGEVPLVSNIPGEAEKTVAELCWITGGLEAGRVEPSRPEINLQCARVDEPEGHVVQVEFTLATQANRAEVAAALEGLERHQEAKDAPSAPNRPLMLVQGPVTREQHLWADGEVFETPVHPGLSLRSGMAIVAGDLEVINSDVVRLRALSHNTVRGAAGGVTLLAEVALRR